MEEALSCIGKMPIFSGIREEELYTLIKCCDGQMAVFEKDQWIFQAGEELGYIMVVLKGRLAIIQEDFWHQQKETIHIMPGEIFGENYASAGSKILPVGIKAAENSEVLFLDYERSLTFCTMACPFHSMMVHNLIRIMSANKGRAEEKLEHISQKTTRDKLRSYLSRKALQEGSYSFDIPYNRQELADYLGVDRSAMSSELGKILRNCSLKGALKSFGFSRQAKTLRICTDVCPTAVFATGGIQYNFIFRCFDHTDHFLLFLHCITSNTLAQWNFFICHNYSSEEVSSTGVSSTGASSAGSSSEEVSSAASGSL